MVRQATGFRHPRWRDDLVFSLRPGSGQSEYLIQDRVGGRYYRVGAREYTFITYLDGTRSASQALADANRQLTLDIMLSPEEAHRMLGWLQDEGLIHSDADESSRRAGELQTKMRAGRFLRVINLIFIRIPLINPDRLLERITPWLSWMLGPSFFAVWGLVLTTGLYQVVAHWDRFKQASQGVLYPGNWLWLVLAWVTLKVLHELFHGLVSKKYGGRVYEAGVILILFVPVGYVDATTSWQFPSRRQRAHTAAAGMFIELLIGGIAAWVWAYSRAGIVNDVAFNCMLIAAVSSVLFNANPLMRFDGYFILSDMVNIPNLYQRGRARMLLVLRRVLGIPSQVPSQGKVKDAFILLYGFTTFFWRIMVLTIILIAASHLWYGAGVVLVGIALGIFVGIPMSKLIRFVISADENVRPMLGWAAVRLVGLAVIGGALLVFLPWRGNIVAPAVVDYAELSIVRAQSPGFVTEIRVSASQSVDEGQVLVVLENRELSAAIAVLEKRVQESRLRSRIHLSNNNPAAQQIEEENLNSLQARLRDKQAEQAELSIRASRDGEVIGRKLPTLMGSFVAAGTPVLAIADESEKEIVLSIDQDDMGDLDIEGLQGVVFRVWGLGSDARLVNIDKLNPRASTDIHDAKLTSLNGGPIPVRPVTAAIGTYQFLTPRVAATAKLSPAQSRRLFAGEEARVNLPSQSRPLGIHLYVMLNRWIRHLFAIHKLPV